MEKRPKIHSEHAPNQFDFNIGEAWDSESECALFIEKLKELNLYGPEFLYSGFDGEDAKKIPL